MNRINVFYHVWQQEGWEQLFQSQIMSLYTSGLCNECEGIYICINGKHRLPFELPKFHVRFNTNFKNESDTLKEMWNFCSVVKDSKILYIHTKGIGYGTSLERPCQDAWRLYLEFYNIYKWKECVKKLEIYDAVGTELDNYPKLYVGYKKQIPALKNAGIFVGNFWWANSEYIKTLDPNYIHKYNVPHIVEGFPQDILEKLSDNDKQEILRFNSELWIGSNNPKLFSFKQYKVAFYDTNILYKLEEFK